MKFCAQCGQPFDSDDAFCGSCGQPKRTAAATPAVQQQQEPLRQPEGGVLKTLWRKGAMSFKVDMNGSEHELRIIKTSFGAFTVFLDQTQLDPPLKVPKIFTSAQEIGLPDGSSVRISAWGAFGWTLERNGLKLRAVSRKPVLVQTLLVMVFALIVGAGTGYSVWWMQRPEWKKANPPAWAFFATSSGDSGKARWFINTKVLRKDDASQTVEVLMRHQTVASREAEKDDIPKDDEYTSVENFTCDPRRQGYDLSANLKGYTGKQIPETIPPQSELPRALAWRDFAQIQPGTIIAEAREAACYLAGYQY